MKSISNAARCALGVGVAAILAGCSSGSQALAPAAPPASLSQSGMAREVAQHHPSWVVPRFTRSTANARRSGILRSAKSKAALLYVAYSGAVNLYSWPALGSLGTLTEYGQVYGICSDAKGDVYIPDDEAGKIYEYAHGGKKAIKTLDDSYGEAQACSVDPVTGNLAVTNFVGPGSAAGNLLVYPGASGSPTMYTASGFDLYFFPAYDDKGNVFVNGNSGVGSATGLLAELPKGGSSLESITMNQTIGFVGGLMWDGKYLAYGDQINNVIYQFTVSGTQATEEGATTLDDSDDVFQFWVTGIKKGRQGTEIAAADYGSGAAEVYDYPGGENDIASVTGLDGPEGVTISRK
jgi:hypothetical protein